MRVIISLAVVGLSGTALSLAKHSLFKERYHGDIGRATDLVL